MAILPLWVSLGISGYLSGYLVGIFNRKDPSQAPQRHVYLDSQAQSSQISVLEGDHLSPHCANFFVLFLSNFLCLSGRFGPKKSKKTIGEEIGATRQKLWPFYLSGYLWASLWVSLGISGYLSGYLVGIFNRKDPSQAPQRHVYLDSQAQSSQISVLEGDHLSPHCANFFVLFLSNFLCLSGRFGPKKSKKTIGEEIGATGQKLWPFYLSGYLWASLWVSLGISGYLWVSLGISLGISWASLIEKTPARLRKGTSISTVKHSRAK